MDPQKESELKKPRGIAERLARLRDTSGLNQAQIADQLGWPRTKVSKLETGNQIPSRDDLIGWARVCGDPSAADELLALREKVVVGHAAYQDISEDSSVVEIQADFNEAMREAKRIRNFEMSLIPGLLQIPEYIHWRSLEVNEVYGFTDDPDDVVRARTERQNNILYDRSHEFEFVITEAALALAAAPPAVMASQIDRLITISGQPNVTFGIIPFYTTGKLDVLPMHGFVIVDDITFLETHAALDNIPPSESRDYDKVMDLFVAEAVTGDEVQQILRASFTRWRSIAAGE